MTTRFTAGLLALATCGALLAGPAAAAPLYNPALGTLPAAQGWLTLGTPGYTQSVGGGVYTFDTTLANAVSAGSAMFGLPALDTVAGFTLDFDLRVVSEAHANANRGGFSVIVTGLDATHSLELAFWNDRVFAYTGSFTHGTEGLLDTTVATDYSLVVANNQYTLFGDGASLLSGALVDYTAQGAPYTQAGFLFFGDDTTSARARVELGAIALGAAAVGAVPEPGTTVLLGAGLLGLVGLKLGRRAQPRGIARG